MSKVPSNTRYAVLVDGKKAAVATCYITALVSDDDALAAILESAAQHDNARIVKQTVKNDGTILTTEDVNVNTDAIALEQEAAEEFAVELALLREEMEDDAPATWAIEDDEPDSAAVEEPFFVEDVTFVLPIKPIAEHVAAYDDDALLQRSAQRSRKGRVRKQYATNDVPGLIYATTSRLTKTHVHLYRVDQSVRDELDATKGAYALVCTNHQQVAYIADRRQGRDSMGLVYWCSECQASLAEKDRSTGPAPKYAHK